MAVKRERAAITEVEVEEEEEETEIWIKHYSSFHQILLVGEGDFSFSFCLAHSFRSGSNIVATCLDQYGILSLSLSLYLGTVIKKYKNAKSNLENLEKLGASLLDGVDATKMKLHTDLCMRKFDRIIFNFPHAGFHGKEDQNHLIKKHKNLVRGFFKSASGMLRSHGEIHVNHKTTPPFCRWNLEELASLHSLALTECTDFKREDYLGYDNKRGAGPRCDEPFPLGECSTFKFKLCHNTKKMSRVTMSLGFTDGRSHQIQGRVPQMQNFTSLDFSYPRTDYSINMHDFQGYGGSSLPINIRSESSRTFYGYFTRVVEIFGRTGYDVGYFIHATLRIGFERYMAAAPGRTLHGYISYLQELHHLSTLRSVVLHNPSPGTFLFRYFTHVVEMFGRSGFDVDHFIYETLRIGFKRYMAEASGRSLNGYINHLQEIHRLNILRTAWMQRMLLAQP
ncbi:hypothetical protein HHK36_021101 [Tetracentron sinense]|uniref:25S rRNA (uridine-N(3))-methyltransferase BMT5-like domain-containing protein n=1 Tax=Tetracentron sinense TaxID=13715 RepID=A0A834YQW8_TETSI|nr:hypothetical protein HHK36_021101 [Tetracentron sinense]